MVLVPDQVVTLQHAVPPIQSLLLPSDVPLGTGVMVGNAVRMLAEDGSPVPITVSIGNPIGVQHVVVPALVLDHSYISNLLSQSLYRLVTCGLLGLSHVVKSSRVVVENCGSLP